MDDKKNIEEKKVEKKIKRVTGVICPSCKTVFIHKRAVSLSKCNNCGYKPPAQTGEAKQGVFPVGR
jgi:ribosomal protein L37AE/L43A